MEAVMSSEGTRRVEAGQARAEVTVFWEKADGTKIIVANASALEGQ
jgi:hypothetical protein